MKQLRTLDLTRIKVVENMEYIQTMRKKNKTKPYQKERGANIAKNPLMILKIGKRKFIKQRISQRKTTFPNFIKGRRFHGING